MPSDAFLLRDAGRPITVLSSRHPHLDLVSGYFVTTIHTHPVHQVLSCLRQTILPLAPLQPGRRSDSMDILARMHH